MKGSEEEYMSRAHNTKDEDKDKIITMWTVYAKKMNIVPTGCKKKHIKQFVDIAHNTNQSSTIMNLLLIDDDTPIS